MALVSGVTGVGGKVPVPRRGSSDGEQRREGGRALCDASTFFHLRPLLPDPSGPSPTFETLFSSSPISISESEAILLS